MAGEKSASVGGFVVGKAPEGEGRPARHGEDWRVGEVALVYTVAKSDEARKRLAQLLERTEDAVDFAWRWCDEAQFPEEAENRIADHLKRVKEILGEDARGNTQLP